MNVNQMSREDFESLSTRKWDEDIGEIDSIVIMPTNEEHDSGYGCMDFIAVRGDEAICSLSGVSDVVHLNGIGGFGDNWLRKYGGVPDKISPISWSIDCLLKSGFLRLFCSKSLRVGPALSSFEIYPVEQIERDDNNE